MTARQSSAKPRVVSASSIRDALADSLRQIKHDDALSFADLGRVLGKSEDQAAKYCDGRATMDAITYHFAKQAWNGRFTRVAEALIGYGADRGVNDHECQSTILKAVLALSVALEDGQITDDEIRRDRKTLENARDAIDALLNRLAPRGVSA